MTEPQVTWDLSKFEKMRKKAELFDSLISELRNTLPFPSLNQDIQKIHQMVSDYDTKSYK